MPRKPKEPTVAPTEAQPQEKAKRTIDPDSPTGIKNAWARAETEYRKAKESVVKLTGEVNAALHKEQAAAAWLTKIAAKVKALLPPDEAKP